MSFEISITTALLNILDIARDAKPDNDSVQMLDKLLETMNIDAHTQIRDEDRQNNVVWEGEDNTDFLAVLEAIETSRLDSAEELELSTETNINDTLTSEIIITMSRNDDPELSRSDEQTILLTTENLPTYVKGDEDDLIEQLTEHFKTTVFGKTLDEVNILQNDNNEYVDEVLFIVELEGFEWLIKNLMYMASEDSLIHHKDYTV